MIIRGLTSFTTNVSTFIAYLKALTEDTAVVFVFHDDTSIAFQANELIAVGREILNRHGNAFASVGGATASEEALDLLEAIACFRRTLGREKHATNSPGDIVTRLLLVDVGRRLRGLVQEIAFMIADEDNRANDALRWSKSRPKLVDVIRDADEGAADSPPKMPLQMSTLAADMLRNALPATDSLLPTTDKKKAFACSFILEDGSTCQYSVGRRDYLETHQAKAHGKDGNEWVCSRCNYKSFGQKHEREGPCAKKAKLEALAVASAASAASAPVLLPTRPLARPRTQPTPQLRPRPRPQMGLVSSPPQLEPPRLLPHVLLLLRLLPTL